MERMHQTWHVHACHKVRKEPTWYWHHVILNSGDTLFLSSTMLYQTSLYNLIFFLFIRFPAIQTCTDYGQTIHDLRFKRCVKGFLATANFLQMQRTSCTLTAIVIISYVRLFLSFIADTERWLKNIMSAWGNFYNKAYRNQNFMVTYFTE